MPGWSPEVANAFLVLAKKQGRSFDQMQLQKLVYIAHGWCLAETGDPLTGDRPEAWIFGPCYRRLADALASYGTDPVACLIARSDYHLNEPDVVADGEFNTVEEELILHIFDEYGALSAPQLATLTQGKGTPWEEVYASGAGLLRDISHQRIRAQFEDYVEEN